MIRSVCCIAFLAFLPFATLSAQEETKPPKPRQVKEWIAEYQESGSRSMGPERVRQLEIMEGLGASKTLSASEEKKWRKSLLKTWGKLDGLPFEKGDNHYWEEEKRGRYIVGGKTKKPKGLLIAMHGGGVGSADASGAAGMYSGPASNRDWLMIAPQALEATERGWTDSGTEEWVLDLVEEARRSFDIDANNVVFAGHSMGGYGSWTLGAHHADRVAALCPSAGAPSPIMDRDTKAIIDIDWGIIPSLRNVPMVVFQSIDDPRVPLGPNRYCDKAVKEARERWGGYAGFDYWEVDGLGHGAPPGGPTAQFDRLTSTVRQPVQDVVIWQPALDWKRQFYWLHWENPAMGSIVEGRIDRENNKISVTTKFHKESEPGSGLSVVFDKTLVDMSREVIVEFQGKVVFQGLPERRLEVLLETSTCGDPDLLYVSRVLLQSASE